MHAMVARGLRIPESKKKFQKLTLQNIWKIKKPANLSNILVLGKHTKALPCLESLESKERKHDLGQAEYNPDAMENLENQG